MYLSDSSYTELLGKNKKQQANDEHEFLFPKYISPQSFKLFNPSNVQYF